MQTNRARMKRTPDRAAPGPPAFQLDYGEIADDQQEGRMDVDPDARRSSPIFQDHFMGIPFPCDDLCRRFRMRPSGAPGHRRRNTILDRSVPIRHSAGGCGVS